MPKKTVHDLWVVERGEAQWLAWREWRGREFKTKFWPDKATVPSEWPPETPALAAAYADGVREQRKQIIEEEKKAKRVMRGSWPEIPISPSPWLRWSERECYQRVTEFRERENPTNALTKADEARIKQIMEQFGMPSRQGRRPLPAESAGPRERTTQEQSYEQNRPYDLAKLAQQKVDEQKSYTPGRDE